MESGDEIRHLSDRVEGFLGRREGPYLFRPAKRGARLGVIVEIGSWKGKSTIWLAKGSEAVAGQPVYAVDPHTGGADFETLGYTKINTEKEFRDNITRAGVEDRVIPLVMPSPRASEGWQWPIGFLWIDGDHRYEGVSMDFHSWAPHVVAGGIVAFHDTYSWEGVRRVVDEEILRAPGYKVLGQMDGILAIEKRASLSLIDQANIFVTRSLRGVYNRARIGKKHWRALPTPKI